MSEKQLTVAELLAKAGREGEGGGEETPRRRRRRSVDSGGVSVAELTGRIPKVEAKPTESRHSSSPLDTEETYTGPFSAVAPNSLFGDAPTEAGHVTSLFDDHGDIGQDGRSPVEQSDPSEPPATLSFFSKTDNPGGAMGGPSGSGGSGGAGVSSGAGISGGAGGAGIISGPSETTGSSYTSSNSRDAVSAVAAHKPPAAAAPNPAAAASSTIASSTSTVAADAPVSGSATIPDSATAATPGVSASAVASASSASSATAHATPSATLPTMPKPMIRPAMKPVMRPVMKQSLAQESAPSLTPDSDSEQPFVDLTPSDDSTIVLSVVDEGGPVRLTTGTFPRLKDHHFTKASVEDLAQPPELPMQKKVAQPTRAEKALTESFQKVSDESATAARLGYRTGQDTHRGLSDELVNDPTDSMADVAPMSDVADASADSDSLVDHALAHDSLAADSEDNALDHTVIAGFPTIADPVESETTEFDDAEDYEEVSIEETSIKDVEDDYDYDDAYEYDDADDAYPNGAYAGGMFADEDFADDDVSEDDSDDESDMDMNAVDATGVMEFEESQFETDHFDTPQNMPDTGRNRFAYRPSHLPPAPQEDDLQDDLRDDLQDDDDSDDHDIDTGRAANIRHAANTRGNIDNPAEDPFIDNFDEFEEEFEDDFDEESANEKMSVLAILGMAAVGVLVGVGVFAGFQILWDSVSNKLIVAGLACVAIAAIVGAVHMLRTSWDGFSMTLAGLVGITMTFGPLAVVNMAS